MPALLVFAVNCASQFDLPFLSASLCSHSLAAHSSLGSAKVDQPSLPASLSHWAQIIADATAGRRLFARARFTATSSPVCCAEELQRRLDAIITFMMQQMVKALQAANAADGNDHSPVAAKAAQIEAIHAAAHVAATAKMDGVDLGTLSPAEAVCLLPPWLRSGREDASQHLVSLLLQLRRENQDGGGMPDDVLPTTVPATTVVVLGNTGAGKSTLLNAFLGEVSLLPTNAMRACTASIIEIEYNLQQLPGKEYTAEVEFVSVADWEREVKEAFALVRAANSGNVPFKAPEQDTPAHEAWCKLRAAYGSDLEWTSPEAILARPPPLLPAGSDPLLVAKQKIHATLGTTDCMTAGSGSQLEELYNKCVDSVNDGSEGSLWPIVKRVLLRGPWNVLSLGVRLVDAPGLADDNSARDAVVKKILQQANAVWLVSNIRRAVNDKTTKDMMLPSFKQSLVEKGVLGSLCFIATHSDVLLKSEVTENLNLPEGTSLLECARARNDYFRNKMASDFKRGLFEREEDAKMREAQHAVNVRVFRDQTHWNACGQSWFSSALQTVSGLNLTEGQRSIALQQFQQRVRQHAAYEGRLVAIRPVREGDFEFVTFAVSAVDYQKLAGLRKGDGVSVYQTVDDTQIPALRDFVKATAGLQRLSAFRAGAELVRCLEEAKKTAEEEEAAMMQEEEAAKGSTGPAGVGKAPKGPGNSAPVVSVPPAVIAFQQCRYCSSIMGFSSPFNQHKSCGNGSYVHLKCWASALDLMKPGAMVTVFSPGDAMNGKVFDRVSICVCLCACVCVRALVRGDVMHGKCLNVIVRPFLPRGILPSFPFFFSPSSALPPFSLPFHASTLYQLSQSLIGKRHGAPCARESACMRTQCVRACRRG